MNRPKLFLIACWSALGICPAAWAQAAEDHKQPEWLQEGSIGGAIPMLADPGGLRQALWTGGIKFQLNYNGEVLGNVGGGLQRGARPGGRLELVVDADLDKAFGWTGAALHTNLFQINGTGLSRYEIGNLMPVSNIEALPSTRLFEAWLEQSFAEARTARSSR